MEEINSSANVWNAKVSTSDIFQCTRTLPHTPSWGYWIVWTSTHKVNVDGGEAPGIIKGFGYTKSMPRGFYGGGINDISIDGVY